MKRPALQNERVAGLRMAFRARKVFGTFEKRAPGCAVSERESLFFFHMQIVTVKEVTSH